MQKRSKIPINLFDEHDNLNEIEIFDTPKSVICFFIESCFEVIFNVMQFYRSVYERHQLLYQLLVNQTT